jgi:hypothetical protein
MTETSRNASAAGPSAASHLRREWKGERGLPVFIAQYGLAFRARQTLEETLLEMADRSGGPFLDRFGMFRSLRALIEAGGEGNRDSLHDDIGFLAWDDARPRLADRQLIIPANDASGDPVLGMWRLNPRVSLQLVPALNQVFNEWKPVSARRWEETALRFEREGQPAEEISLKNVASRVFDASNAWKPEEARNLLWLSCVRLAESPRGAVLPVSKGSERAALALEPLRHYALASPNDKGDWSFSPEAPLAEFAEMIALLRTFAGGRRAEKAAQSDDPERANS